MNNHWGAMCQTYKFKWQHNMKLINLSKYDYFSNKIPHYSDTFVSYWHSFYIHCSGRSNFLPHVQPFSTIPSANLYTLSNKNPSALSFLRPELEVTWRTAAIIIRVLLLSPYLRIRGVSLSSIYGWKTRVGNYQKLKTDLAVTIQSLTLCWVEAESLYRSVLRVSRCNPSSWTRASSSLRK